MLNFSLPKQQTEVIDKSTGLMSRAWYLFFQGLSSTVGSGISSLSIDDLQTVLLASTRKDSLIEDLRSQLNDLEALVVSSRVESLIENMRNRLDVLEVLFLATQRVDGATVGANQRTDSARKDAP